MISDRIWVTRKARINTEKRLLRNSLVSEILLTYYSLSVVIFSVWNLTRPNGLINLLLVSASVVVLVLSIFLSSQKFRERALAMRNCYVRLEELHQKASQAEEERNKAELQEIEQLYRELLIGSENHSETDYLYLRYTLRNNKNTTLPDFTKIDFLKYWLRSVTRLIFTVLIFLLPICMVVIIWKVCG